MKTLLILAAIALAGCREPSRTVTREGFIQRVNPVGVIHTRWQIDLWENIDATGLDGFPHILTCEAPTEQLRNQADDAINTGHRVRLTLKVVPDDMPIVARIERK